MDQNRNFANEMGNAIGAWAEQCYYLDNETTSVVEELNSLARALHLTRAKVGRGCLIRESDIDLIRDLSTIWRAHYAL